jgi:hypothetical protein
MDEETFFHGNLSKGTFLERSSLFLSQEQKKFWARMTFSNLSTILSNFAL